MTPRTTRNWWIARYADTAALIADGPVRGDVIIAARKEVNRTRRAAVLTNRGYLSSGLHELIHPLAPLWVVGDDCPRCGADEALVAAHHVFGPGKLYCPDCDEHTGEHEFIEADEPDYCRTGNCGTCEGCEAEGDRRYHLAKEEGWL